MTMGIASPMRLQPPTQLKGCFHVRVDYFDSRSCVSAAGAVTLLTVAYPVTPLPVFQGCQLRNRLWLEALLLARSPLASP
jgi:hypothetical protein